MKRLKYLTTGEKALVAMVVAGVFGYWAGFNLPGLALPFPVAVAAAQFADHAPEAVPPDEAPAPMLGP